MEQDVEYEESGNDSFFQFVQTAAAREIEYYITHSSFTQAFNYRVNKLIEEIKKINTDIEFSVIYNTEGEICVIDSAIIGNFVADMYFIELTNNYKEKNLHKILSNISSNTEEIKEDFVRLSMKSLFNILDNMYKSIQYKKDIFDKYKAYYYLDDENDHKSSLMVIAILILEDICRHLKIKYSVLIKCSKEYDTRVH